ncbi:MAG TPA: hypothetical protein VFO58_12395 [Vicinamibacterales bacterium]|nr:hypothetical protein [Vicinamibacterales bacterium]
MPRYSVCTVLVAGLIAGCSGPELDAAKPVVTPSFSLSSPKVTAGRPFEFALRFAVSPDAPAFTADYVVFVHFIDDKGKMIGAADHPPPTPTREWKAGSTVEYSHTAFPPTADYRGDMKVVVGLYLPSSNERVPIAGELFEPRAVTVGSFTLTDLDDPYPVSFREGWHSPESVKTSGVQWRWSMKSGRLSFPNPKRDVVVVIQADQPAPAFVEEPQTIQVKLGDSVVDTFRLATGPAELRRISLTQSQLGDGQTVDLAVVSDKTFVPAKLEALKSGDTRQLGVRVFRAYVEPK